MQGYTPPPQPPQFPQRVEVANTTSAEAFYTRLKRRERGLLGDLADDEVLYLEYHSPAGERLRVRDVGYYTATDDTLILVCEDGGGNECQVIAQVPTLHVIFRIVRSREPVEEERRPIGFFPVEPEEGEGP